MTHKPLDLKKIEVLRRQMMLTVGNFTELLGVSRATYYNWLKAHEMRHDNHAKMVATVRTLLAIMVDHNWPTPDVIGMAQRDRFTKLKEIFATYE